MGEDLSKLVNYINLSARSSSIPTIKIFCLKKINVLQNHFRKSGNIFTICSSNNAIEDGESSIIRFSGFSINI